MVAFKKVEYPDYRISKVGSGHVPPFSYFKFIKWESSCELNFAYEEAGNLDYLFEKKNLHENIGDDNILNEKIEKFRNKILLIIDPFNHIIKSDSDKDSCDISSTKDLELSTRNLETSIHPHQIIIMLFDKAQEGFMSFSLLISLCSIICLISYIQEMERLDEKVVNDQNNRLNEKKYEKKYEKIEMINNSKVIVEKEKIKLKDEVCNGDEDVNENEKLQKKTMIRPDFFVQLDGGALLAHLCNEGTYT
jgi:hypothetical protein